ncbi:MAG: DUF427 domain-containing protein [Myxococcota bacterium]
MSERESLYHRHPDYRVDLEPSPGRVVVRLGGQTIADSTRTLRVLETRHEPVVYFPREDVRMDLLEATDHRTFCPFKGEAAYWTVRAGDRVEENAVWGYPEPFEQVAGLKDYVSFYTDRLHQEELD